MKITFLLPTGGRIPIGGYKVVYHHANELAKRGHEVSIVHRMDKAPGTSRLIRHARFVKSLVTGEWRPTKWFEVDRRIELKWCLEFTAAAVDTNDILVSTSWITAECAHALPRACGEKFYLGQDYAHYMSGSEAVRERIAQTFRYGFTTLVISPACEELAKACGGTVHAHVPNGLNHSLYRCLIPVDSPLRNGIGFPCRDESFKRTEDAIEALARVRLSSLSSTCRYWSFGNKRPRNLPRWIEFYERPSDKQLVELHNRSLIFLVPSDYEGWGLPGSEAMCCGAALVSTDNGGVRAYAEHNRNALLSPARNVGLLAENMLSLLTDKQLRVRLAIAGTTDIRRFTWERGAEAVEMAFIKHMAAAGCPHAGSRDILRS